MRKTWRRQLALGLAVVTIWTSGNAEHFYAGQKDCGTPAISTERLTDTEQKINLDKVNYQVEKSAYAPVFDASYYAKNNKDLKIAFGNDENALFQHFLNYGMSEGRQASAEFNVKSYRNAYADLRQAFGNDLKSYYLHYMNCGKKEGRKAAGVTTLQNPVTVYNGVNYSPVYNYNYYISRNPDVARAFPDDDISTLAHFVNYGMTEGRRGAQNFDVASYRNAYADLRQAFGNDLKSYYLHYMNCGKREGRKPTGVTLLQNPVTTYNGKDYAAVYNYDYYISKYSDLKKAFAGDDSAAIRHFVECGMAEGRQAGTDFILGVYKSNYSDLRAAFGNDNKSYYLHYIDCGKKEGRNAVTKIGTPTKPEPNPEPNPEPGPAPGPEPEEPATTEDKIKAKVAKISNEYGVTVLTGDSAGFYWTDTYCSGETDPETTLTWITMVDEQMARYPKGFFTDMQDITTVTIKLVHNLDAGGGSFAGVTSREYGDQMFIALNTSQSFLLSDRTFNHEMMHLIEYYIEAKSWNASTQQYESPLKATEAIKPDAEVNSTNNDYTTSDYNRGCEEQYYISAYAKTNGREDRAETFTDYMFRAYKKDYMIRADYPIPKKQQIIADCIRQYFPSAASQPAGSLSWEKWLP
ncbi:MAG: hypothetical protein ACLT3R_03790 [Roseburia sp.]